MCLHTLYGNTVQSEDEVNSIQYEVCDHFWFGLQMFDFYLPLYFSILQSLSSKEPYTIYNGLLAKPLHQENKYSST